MNFHAFGRLANEVELSSTKSGKSLAKFRLAIPRPYSTKRPDGAQDADFINCVSFGSTAEFIHRNFNKGSRALVEGSIRTDKYEKEGKTRYSIPYVLLETIQIIDFKSKDANSSPSPTNSAVESNDDGWGEDIPF